MTAPNHLKVIDSHTGGEPTRVIIDDLNIPSHGAISARDHLQSKADWVRTSLILEPRGFDAMVGAYLCAPLDESCTTGVVFFNNHNYLGGCIHGTIGVVKTLAYLKRIQPGTHKIETPTGIISATLADDHNVTIQSVPSFRAAENVTLEVPNLGTVTGDIAFSANWFFLVSSPGPAVHPSNIEELTQFTSAIRDELIKQNITGPKGEEIDHIEVFGPPMSDTEADSQNFVLCPGKAYDRSPCGTGTSAKLACLAASQKLAPGETWRQASIIGTIFTGSYQNHSEPAKIIPTISGEAHINAETTIILNPSDPFQHGINY